MKWVSKIKDIHYLSGIVLISNNKILLVKPKKFKGKKKKYSIPKGHIENDKKLKSALKEFREETSMKLDKNYDFKFETKYIKNNILKKLKVYVYFRNDFELSVNYKKLDKEIFKVKFFNKKDAMKKVEHYFKPIIKTSFNKKELLNEKFNYKKSSKLLYNKIDKFFHLSDAIVFRDELKEKIEKAYHDLKNNNINNKESLMNIRSILLDITKGTFIGSAYIFIPGSLLIIPFIQKFLKNKNNKEKIQKLFKKILKS